ncbi:MAG TPA: hypothetical protein VGK84_05735 [Candidatus Tumulicola sp.]
MASKQISIPLRFLSALAALVLITLGLGPGVSANRQVASARTLSSTDVRHWRADLHFMADAITRYHKNAFHSVSKRTFDRAVTELDARIPTMTRPQAIVGLKRIIAMIGDEHTGFGLSTGAPIFFHTLPIKVYKYSDGYFVQSAAPNYRSIVGRRIVGIGSLSIEEAMSRLFHVADTSNEWSFYSQVAFLMRGEVLNALGITASDDRAEIRLAGPAGIRKVELQTIPHPFNMEYGLGAPPGSDWIDSRQTTAAPLYLQRTNEYYWYAYTPDHVLYVRLKFVLNAPREETLAVFFDHTFAFADSHDTKKLVLDIRNNGGGDNTLTSPIIQNIVMRPALNQRGKLFVIIGRDTASAAQNLTDRLQRDTNAVFVGEPTSEWPNHYGDPQAFVLPYSHISVHISSLFWQDLDPRDQRKWTGPDIAAELTSAEYAQNIDPAMDAISSFHDVALTDELRPSIALGDEPGVEKAYAAFFSDPLHKYAQEQSVIDTLAHDCIDKKQPQMALVLFQLNLKSNPGSNLAFDGLGDGFTALKERGAALNAYRAALQIDPHDAIAASSISQINSGP